MLNARIQALLRQASSTAKYAKNAAESVQIQAIFITPEGQYRALGCLGMVEIADFANKDNHSEMIQITCRFQPGIYFNKIVPFRDDLKVQLIVATGSDKLLREFVGVPLVSKDVKAEGNNTGALNLEALDVTNLVEYKFQLIDPGYAKLKNVPVSNIYQMTNIEGVIGTVMQQYTEAVGMTGSTLFKGLQFHRPIDNTNMFDSVEIPNGTKLVDVPTMLQNDNDYGVYTKGLTCFYKQNYWWVVPIFNTELVDTHPRPLEIVRVPENKIPDLDVSYYRSDVAMTIIACGRGDHTDNADIDKQNDGVGQRILLGEAVAGDTGYHYQKGRAITTRADTLQEYKLSDRRSGEEWVPLNPNPTGNLCVPMTQNAINEGEIIEVEWRNGDTGYLEPGHPLHYQYMYDETEMIVRKGVLLGYRTDYIPINAMPNPILKRTTILKIFVKRREQFKVA